MIRSLSTFAALACLASPASAQAGTAIPEPSNLALFGIGLAGLVIGRHVARRQADSDD